MNTFEEQKTLDASFVMGTYKRKPVQFVRGEGMRLYDDTGKEYLDFLAGIGAVSLGHCHPALVTALAEQAQKLMHVSNLFYIEERGEVARLLSDLLNEGASSAAPVPSSAATAPVSQVPTTSPWQSFFANSGAEANECAIKLARLWGKQGGNGNLIVTLERSFHGRTLATLAATAQPGKQEAFRPLPGGFVHLPFNDVKALEELFETRGSEICALMIEVVQGEAGVYPCSQDYLDTATRLLKKHKALLICDEVQSGIYRCGSHPFAFQHFGIVPDIVTTAKGIASGFPTGACSAREEIARSFDPGDHGSTFGGNNLAITAIAATLGELSGGGYARSVAEVGEYFRTKLAELPRVKEVRGLGLMNAVEFDAELDAADLNDRMLEEGFVLNNPAPHTLRFLPPLVCTKEEVDRIIEALFKLLAV